MIRLALSLALGLVAVVMLGACGDDDGPAAPTLPGGRTSAPSAPGDAGPASKLAANFLAGVDGVYVYRYTGPIGDVKEGVLTVYRQGINDRQDWTTNQLGFDATTVSILGETDNYLCSVAGAVNNCRAVTVPEVEGLRIIVLPVYNALIALVTEHEMFDVEELGSETYAGLEGNCYRAFSDSLIGQGPPSSEEIKVCFTEEGAIVYFERTTTPESASIQPATFTLELQETREALPSDFEPTASVQ